MNKMIKIRNEEETDYERVEEITRKYGTLFGSCYAISQRFSAGVGSGD